MNKEEIIEKYIYEIQEAYVQLHRIFNNQVPMQISPDYSIWTKGIMFNVMVQKVGITESIELSKSGFEIVTVKINSTLPQLDTMIGITYENLERFKKQ